jgi:hypothetical protein
MTTTPATVTLKAFKHIKAMSEETLCFTAAVLVNGVIVGHAENRGHGGCTFLYPVNPSLCIKHLEAEVDRLADEMVNAKETERLRKRIAKDLATTVIFTRNGDKAGSFRTLKARFATAEEARNAATDFAKRDATVDKVLNLLPFDEAFGMLVKIG